MTLVRLVIETFWSFCNDEKSAKLFLSKTLTNAFQQKHQNATVEYDEF